MMSSPIRNTCVVGVFTSVFLICCGGMNCAYADTIQLECGSSGGYVYTAKEGLHSTDHADAGWGEDGVPNGMSILELDTETLAISYRWRHFSGSWHSVEGEGVEPVVVSFDKTDFSWQMVTLFEGGDIVEVCTFAEILGKNPKALCTTSKNFEFLTSARVFVSDCKATIIPTSG